MNVIWDKTAPFNLSNIAILYCMLAVLALVGMLAAIPVAADTSITPAYCEGEHNIGQVVSDATNYSLFGLSKQLSPPTVYPCFPDFQLGGRGYPKGGEGVYTPWGIIMIGGIRVRDTLVSGIRMELLPDESPFGEMKYRSTLDPSSPAFVGAVSEQDFVAVFTDTLELSDELDPLDYRRHLPMNIEITQESYAWSYAYADDFVFYNYRIRNLGDEPLEKLYMGLVVDPRVYHWARMENRAYSVFGFLKDYVRSGAGCDAADTVDLAWIAHWDGYLDLPVESGGPLPHIGGVRFLGLPEGARSVAFNWWAMAGDTSIRFGPEMRDRIYSPGTAGKGEPSGDRHWYHTLSNGEIDYDPAFAPTIQPTDPTWLYPNQQLTRFMPQWAHSDFLLSAGPFDIAPGEAVPITFAVVLGKHFHTDPMNGRNIEDVEVDYNPDAYYDGVDFSDIVKNSMWASWVYDNPGYDTDGNGYAGEYRLCCGDSAIVSIDSNVTPPDTTWEYDLCEKVWYKGDGVPDWRPATPPPAPKVWVEPSVGEVRIRWNGTLSETTKDIFMHIPDFEGYRVYYSLDTREDSYTLLGSYDKFNYDKYVWNSGWRDWQVLDNPYTHEALCCLYGDSCHDASFDPLLYSRNNPYRMTGCPDSIFFFKEHDFNQSEFGLTTPIEKVYPDQPYPTSVIPDSAEAWELTEEGYLKYFEYELTIDNLLPTVPYYFNVTAFDFGSPESGLDVLETSKTLNPIRSFASPDAGDVDEQNLEVYIYPNPYRIDGGYRDAGFEGRDARWPIPDRMRMIHFANLPAKCWIRIYSLDGDLIREIRHDMDPADPDASHDTWDMITRNTMRPVAGIYYWTVEDDYGDVQIGKLVILK